MRTICGPHDISETTTARKLNLKIPLDTVKHPLRIQKLLDYIVRHNMRVAAILIFDKCLYLRGRLRLTTARRLSAYMSPRAIATTLVIVNTLAYLAIQSLWLQSCHKIFSHCVLTIKHMRWYGIGFNVPLDTFYGSDDLTNSVTALKVNRFCK